MPQKVPPETVALVRRRYAEGAAVAAIQRETGLKANGLFYRCLDGHFDDGSGAPLPLPQLPRRCEGFGGMRSASRRAALVARIWRNAEAQVEKIEQRIAQSEFAPKVVERDARALAVLVRTLRELSALAEMRKPVARKEPKPEDDDTVPTDIEELRRELSRRMQALIDARTGAGVPGEPEE
jgi:hypothetical protein